MSNIFTKAAAAALIAVGAVAASAPANAAQVEVIIKQPVRKQVVVVRPAPVVVVKPAPVVVVKPAYGRCAPGLALQKAANHGLNRVAISNIGPNRVVVTGKTRGVWAKMVFANVRGCPRL